MTANCIVPLPLLNRRDELLNRIICRSFGYAVLAIFDFIAELRVAGDNLRMCQGMGIEIKTENL